MKQLIFPPFLVPGDKVAIVSPSGKFDKNLLKEVKKHLEMWGLKAVLSKNAGAESGTYAGTSKQRLADFQKAMDDKEIKAIFCSRGGYGVVHILDQLNFDKFNESPKWLMGFSDITALHLLFQSHGYASIHSLMGRHLCMEEINDPCSMYLKEMLFGHLPQYSLKPHKLNRSGTAKGILYGGNMSVFNGLRATPYDFPAEGTILFIEDVGERPHCIERMLYNLKLGGVLNKLSGMIIGQFTEFDEDKSLGKELYGAIADILKEYDFPICFNFPVGHVTNNVPLICGAEVEMDVNKKVVTLNFAAHK
ncbi:LD-carboxypeptidase [Bacteroides sp. 214]|uniref:S66 peptidase family protein n=1 Tax=Bacteroides sp. 214 TaxID=2302935 RepID=UPI0013D6DEAD|nr:LD-carboxypeptidase [Bacteroides sp. 214]NDW13072.1 LD-carboxypeptidase [Bacteroides sp. 214]